MHKSEIQKEYGKSFTDNKKTMKLWKTKLID